MALQRGIRGKDLRKTGSRKIEMIRVQKMTLNEVCNINLSSENTRFVYKYKRFY